MKKDVRLQKMAENVLKNSVKLKKGETVYIEADGKASQNLFKEFIAYASKIGATPFYYFNDSSYLKSFLQSASAEQIKSFAAIHADLMHKADAYIAIRGADNIFALSELPDDKLNLYRKFYAKPVHNDIRLPHTRWCVMRYPNDNMAAFARMDTKNFEDFYFKACLLDYAKMDKAMEPLQKLMQKTDLVRIVAPNTDLSFSIKNIPAIKCSGQMNIPDGELFTAPVKNSINGTIAFNTETTYSGYVFANICLTFKNGKIIKAVSVANNDKLQQILQTDEGAKFMGEFSFGLNPYIKKPLLDILFDEKISGSIHMAIGNSYDEAPNGNKSAIHWDLVQIQTKEYGGGEIYFDDVLIRKNGMFVPKFLQGLNPQNLK